MQNSARIIGKSTAFSFFQQEEETQDPFIEISEMKQGDTVYECINDVNFEYVVTVDAYSGIDGYETFLMNSDGYKFCVFVDHNAPDAYLPKFYAIPQIIDQDKRGYFYPIV